MPKTLTPPLETKAAALPAPLSPWEPLAQTAPLGSFSRLFDDFWSTWRRLEGNGTLLSPSLDMSEDAENVWINVELPGLSRNEVKVQIEEGVLTISGEKSVSEDEKKRDYRCVERRYGRFVRSLSLPRSVESDHVEANMKDGVLQIRLPKSAQAKARAIPVK
ncbi:MAG: Hsp20/alpha crystallin family protein [Planctomycetota bacterium]